MYYKFSESDFRIINEDGTIARRNFDIEDARRDFENELFHSFAHLSRVHVSYSNNHQFESFNLKEKIAVRMSLRKRSCRLLRLNYQLIRRMALDACKFYFSKNTQTVSIRVLKFIRLKFRIASSSYRYDPANFCSFSQQQRCGAE